VKYIGLTGSEVWVARYNSPGNGYDEAHAIAVDANGDVYVTGVSFGNYATLKYDGLTGAELWLARYNGPINGSGIALAIALDADGNVYVTGSSQSSATSFDYATIKYNGLRGEELWVARYSDLGSESPNAIAVDVFGDVYVTGRSSGSGVSHYATVKYDGLTGAELWVARYQGRENSFDQAYAMAVDSDGNVFVTGTSGAPVGSNYDYTTVKYDRQTGAELWVARYHGLGNAGNIAYAIALDVVGDVCVTGLSDGDITNNDYATVKYDGMTGTQLWAARYNGPGNGSDVAHAIALDAVGDVYVTGESNRGAGSYDYATVKYEGGTGAELWVARYNGQVNSFDSAWAIALDGMGKVYVTGSSIGVGTAEDYATVKYSQP